MVNSLMSVNGLYASINCPKALKGTGLNRLPPHNPVAAYIVDEYPNCPKDWMHGSAKSSSYFIPIKEGDGMWFDFTNNTNNNHEVAIVVSVQGVNPVDGQPIKELSLQQYKNKCPVHNIDFLQDRYCEKCEYKWTAQNYISTTTGQPLWIDGFRNNLGEVVQYILTEDVSRGVASQIIGDDRVWAIGFAFYLSKEPKKQKNITQFNNNCNNWINYYPYYYPYYYHPMVDFPKNIKYDINPGYYGSYNINTEISCNDNGGLSSGLPKAMNCNSYPKDDANSLIQYSSGSANLELYSCDNVRHISDEDYFIPNRIEIGGGAKISQEIGIDNNPIEFWKESPEGIIYINYTTQDIVNSILKSGKRKDKENGFLSGLKIGNV